MSGFSFGFPSTIDMAIKATEAGCYCIEKAVGNAKIGNKTNALVLGLIGMGWFITGAAATYVAYPATSCEDGELWEGHCYPWRQFPHGQYDCAPGSFLFDPKRSEANEATRRHLLLQHSVCRRGTVDLQEVIKNFFVTCFANGTATVVPNTYTQFQEMKDVL